MAPAMDRRDGMPRPELIFPHSASVVGCNLHDRARYVEQKSQALQRLADIVKRLAAARKAEAAHA